MANQYSKHLLKAYVKLFCPRCFSNKLRKNGFTPEGIKKHFCKKCNFQSTYLLQPSDVELAKTNMEISKKLISEGKKQCSKCLTFKPLDMFYKRKKNKDGYRHRCIGCHKQYRKDNKDKISKRQKEYRLKNKDKIKEYRAEYYLENKDEIRRRNDKWALENKDKLRESRRKWERNNRDKIREHGREYRLKNYELLKDYNKEYRLKNRDRLAENLKEYYFKNKDIYREKGAKYYSENKAVILKKGKIYYKKQSENLTDNYISQLLTKESNLSREDIPQWLIEAKRQQIKLQRIIRKDNTK